MRGRATVAAVASGAVVAAGQAIVSDPPPEPVPVAAVMPVAGAKQRPVVDAIGGDQLPIAGLEIAAVDTTAQLDLKNLTKAADLGAELARRQAIIRAALAHGAPEAHLYRGVAFVKPVLGRLTSGFGARWGTSHNGIDIANSIGTPIFAITDGVVEESGPATGFGLWIVLRHNDGTRSVYGHINRAFVSVGERVKAGEQIAEVGNRGWSTGPHLHLEIWDAAGNPLNPLAWLNRRGIGY